MSRSSSRARAWACRMSATTPSTTVLPLWALALACSAVSAAREAFLATSSTVEFISSMAVAVSPARSDWVRAPWLACSIWAESSWEAEAVAWATSPRVTAAASMASRWAVASL